MTLKADGEHQPMAKQMESTWTRLWISMSNRFRKRKLYARSNFFYAKQIHLNWFSAKKNVTYCVQHATVVDILIYWVTVPRTHIKLPWTRIKVSTARSGTGTCLPRTLASAIPRTVALCCEPPARCPTAHCRALLRPPPRASSSSTRHRARPPRPAAAWIVLLHEWNAAVCNGAEISRI